MIEALIIFLAVFLYSFVHSLLASLPVKSMAIRLFGASADRGYRLIYNVFAAISLLPVLALPALLPDKVLYSIPSPWILLTTFVQGMAVVALIIGLLQTDLWSFLGVQQLFGTEQNNQKELVIRGLYKWVRHPLYTAGLLFIWSTPVMTRNLLVLFFGFSLYLFVGAYFEERRLLHEYGEAYALYCKRTPMIIPGINWGCLFHRSRNKIP